MMNVVLLLGLLACINPSTIKGDGYEAVKIPKGTFDMGCTPEQGDDCRDYEKPVHKVTISNDFYMMKSEVTQGLYEKVIGSNPSNPGDPNGVYRSCRSACPVDQVDWYDAVKFANALSKKEGLEECYSIENIEKYDSGRIKEANVSWSKGVNCTGWRLPTEAEWEYAARGGENYKYAGSNNVDEVAWVGIKDHSVCLKKTNGYGLCDMSGNVYEWVWDWYGVGGYSSASVSDPTGPSTGSSRRIRGGGRGQWSNTRFTRVSYRGVSHEVRRFWGLGFRLTRTIR